MIALLAQAGAAAGAPALESPPLVQNALLLVAGLALLPLAVRLLDRFSPAASQPAVGWGLPHILFAVAVGLVLPAFFFDAQSLQRVLVQLLAAQASLAAAAAVGVYCAHRAPAGVEALGFVPHGNARGIAAGIAFYFLCAPALFAAGNLWVLWSLRVGWGMEQEVLGRLLELRGFESVVAAVLAVGIGPLLEELLFRGFVQPVCVRAMGAVGGVVFTSALFALPHEPVAFGTVFTLSLVLGTLRLRTGRLTVPILVHGMHNALVLLANQLDQP